MHARTHALTSVAARGVAAAAAAEVVVVVVVAVVVVRGVPAQARCVCVHTSECESAHTCVCAHACTRARRRAVVVV